MTSDETPFLHVGYYRKYLLKTSNLLVITGEFEEVRISRRHYESRHHIPPTPDLGLEQFMGACALAAASLADKESWGWSVTLPGIDSGYFCGVEPEGMICARMQPADRDQARGCVQRQKGDEPLTQSHFEPVDANPVTAVETYFKQVVQTPARIELNPDSSGVMLQAMPNSDIDPWLHMSAESFRQAVSEAISTDADKPLQEYLMFYECRCDEEMITRMFDQLPDAQKTEIQQPPGAIEIECPRCGRTYTLRPDQQRNEQ